MPQGSASTLLVVALAATLGCAVHSQSIALPVSPQSEKMLSRVVIEDLRDEADKTTHDVGDGKCGRAHGDDFIEPSKVQYLRSLLAERLAPADRIVLQLKRFDTIERCDLEPTGGDGAPRASAKAAPAGRRSPNPDPQEARGRSEFTLLLMGSLNGEPFRFHRSFYYSDIDYFDFPADSVEYRSRIGRILVGDRTSNPRFVR